MKFLKLRFKVFLPILGLLFLIWVAIGGFGLNSVVFADSASNLMFHQILFANSGHDHGDTDNVLELEPLNKAFIITTDFETGTFATIDLDTREAVINRGSIYSDAVARWFNNLVFVINRFGQDNIQILDPSAGYGTIAQYSTGNGSNPHDIAFVSEEKAYISLYEEPRILIVNPLTGKQLGEIDLTNFADGDGIPEVDSLHLYGNNLYASVQRLDRNNFFVPSGASFVVVIDIATDNITDQIPVEVNPFTNFVELPDGNLLLGSSGNFGVVGDGGINLMDTWTNTNSVVIS